jgi:hypothetical protein
MLVSLLTPLYKSRSRLSSPKVTITAHHYYFQSLIFPQRGLRNRNERLQSLWPFLVLFPTSYCSSRLPEPFPSFSSTDAVLAKITLSALNGDHHPSERVLDLTPERNTIQIGRASKNSSKGLLGAVDNAWFDSPVMSRNHAEISLNPSSNVSNTLCTCRSAC